MFQKPGFSEKPGFFASKLHWLSLPIRPMHLVNFLCHAIFTRSVEPLSNITRFAVVISIFGVSETEGARLHLRAAVVSETGQVSQVITILVTKNPNDRC